MKDNNEEGGKAKGEDDEEEGLKRFFESSILGKILQLLINILKGLADTMIGLKNKA